MFFVSIPTSYIFILERVPALRAGWGCVAYDHTFTAPTCALKKFVTKEKCPQQILNPGP